MQEDNITTNFHNTLVGSGKLPEMPLIIWQLYKIIASSYHYTSSVPSTLVSTKTYHTVVWEKFMVRNVHAKKIHGKKFSSKQATDEKFLTPNIS